MMHRHGLSAAFLMLFMGPAAGAPPAPFSATDAVQFVRAHCVECHTIDDPEAGLDLESFGSADDVVVATDRWNKIINRVAGGQMPPDGGSLPTAEARSAFLTWIRQTIHQSVCGDGISPGGPMLRRLNRNEYANTVRDLLGIHVNTAKGLPVDGGGGEGFDNAAETLFISPIHAEKYLDAARSALGHALKDPRSRQRLIIAQPDQDHTPEQAAREILAKFLPRAFRRPVDDQEVQQYVALFNSAYATDPAYVPAVQLTLEAALLSPKFLMLAEAAAHSDQPELLTDFELASRLSYFLWSSMPDDELMQLAAAGKLRNEDALANQVARMLTSTIDGNGLRRGSKVREFATNFIEQWLGTRAIGSQWQPDETVIQQFDAELAGGMKYEPIFFMEELLADNRSLLNLIDSDFSYLNRRLASHYAIKGEFREQPKRIELPAESRRGGLLGMSAVLAVSSYPHRTSPVLRGKWILEKMLGTPPPPPPPDAGELAEQGDTEAPASLRERLAKHRADTACASCHNTIDPLGFGLENFDVLGRWRTTIDNLPVDARGELPEGPSFDGPDELKALLMERKDQFIRHLTAKMLGYALARGLTDEDRCVVHQISETLAASDYQAQTLIIEIVNSVPFRYKLGSASD